MSNYKEELSTLLENLRTQRDELNLKMHLAKAELRDEWHEVEHKWNHFKSKAEIVLDEVDHTNQEVWQALKPAGTELKEGFKRIKDKL